MDDYELTKIIEKKRNGEKLSADDIVYFVDDVLGSAIPGRRMGHGYVMDRAQMGALLMAIYFKGLDNDETTELTRCMKDSCDEFVWPSEFSSLVVDKHSTGGIGDKISLVLAPALAAVGLKVPMISGRSLDHTGGTLDKLESIPGFRVNLDREEIHKMIKDIGCCIVGQTDYCAPADKILYNCREITATVPCPPLIVASIVSKKLSESPRTLVYDVKYGKGSIFGSKEEAIETARNLVKVSKLAYSELGSASALITSMENPLGKAIGNSLEVEEAIRCLQGNGPTDVISLTCSLGGELLRSLGKEARAIDAENRIFAAIEDGKALKKFHDMIIHQGVSPVTAQNLCYGNAASVLPKAFNETVVYYDGKDGYIKEIDPLVLGKIWKEESINSNKHPGVGFTLFKTVGDKLEKGEAWIKMHHECSRVTDETLDQLKNAIHIDELYRLNPRKLVDRRIWYDGIILTEEIC